MILYTDGDVEKVNAWLSGNRLQLPFPATRVGNKDVSNTSIRNSDENINTQEERFLMERAMSSTLMA